MTVFFSKPTKFVEREFTTEVLILKPLGKVHKADGSYRRAKHAKIGFDHYYIAHYWSFKLPDNLRLNISLENIKFIYLFNFHECVIGNILIRSLGWTNIQGKLERSWDQFKFCGIKSNVINYPRYPHAFISVFARSNVLYSALVFFSVIDYLQVYSFLPKRGPLKFQGSYLYKFQASWGSYLYKFRQFLQTYHITVVKYNILELQAPVINNAFDVYDGPRTRSRLLTPKYYK